MTVVALRREEEVTMVSLLEDAMERAKVGEMRAFVLVEVNREGRIFTSDVFNDLRDPTLMLAVIGGLECMKMSVLQAMD